jgi:hypothetical protein
MAKIFTTEVALDILHFMHKKRTKYTLVGKWEARCIWLPLMMPLR